MEQRKLSEQDINAIVSELSVQLKPIIRDVVSEAVQKEIELQLAYDDTLISATELSRILGMSVSNFSHRGYGDTFPNVTLPGGFKRYFRRKCIQLLLSMSEK